MSMDNGIYVLECRGQYRVKELSTSMIANLGWSFLSFSDTETVVPTRVIEAFRDAKPICSRRFAEHIAFQMLYKEDYVEYGINVIKVDKTWEQIEEEAVPYAEEEYWAIKASPKNDGRWDYSLQELKKIIGGQ